MYKRNSSYSSRRSTNTAQDLCKPSHAVHDLRRPKRRSVTATIESEIASYSSNPFTATIAYPVRWWRGKNTAQVAICHRSLMIAASNATCLFLGDNLILCSLECDPERKRACPQNVCTYNAYRCLERCKCRRSNSVRRFSVMVMWDVHTIATYITVS